MNRPRRQLFPGARFPPDEDGDVAVVSHHLEELFDLRYLRAVAHHLGRVKLL